jgi:hypothetical protein
MLLLLLITAILDELLTVLVSLDRHNKNTTDYFKQQKYALSRFCRLAVKDQGTGRIRFWSRLSSLV